MNTKIGGLISALFLFLITTLATAQPAIQVLSPNTGLESYETEASIGVRWKESGLTTGQWVKIRLKSSTDPVGVVLGGSRVTKGGSFNRSIPANVVPGKYRVAVEVYRSHDDTGSPIVSDESDADFSVTAPPPPPPASLTSITPTSASVGATVEITGEGFKVGVKNQIHFDQPGDGDVFLHVKALDSKKLSFKLPSELGTGSYVVRVNNGSGDSTGRISFSVILAPKPSVTVLSPNGGEIYTVGDSVNITWKSSNFDSLTVWLTLADKYGTSVPGGKLNAANIPNTGSYSWAIPSDIVPAGTSGAFRIVASSFDDGPSAYDLSDSYFTITGPAPAPEPEPEVLPAPRIDTMSVSNDNCRKEITLAGEGLYAPEGITVFIGDVRGLWVRTLLLDSPADGKSVEFTADPSLKVGNYVVGVINNGKISQVVSFIVEEEAPAVSVPPAVEVVGGVPQPVVPLE
ncbi:MAG: GPI anchored serine-threonine rich family protein [bacterium]|nr:GPI anchored serine-threonine rich family protein [bacterium]